MSASIRTLIYAGVALFFAVAAYLTDRAMQPADLSGFDLVGQEFDPTFTEPEKAAKLRVAAYDDLTKQSQVFTVEKDGDSWRIPSHHDYPAEAKKRLAETAASVMGVKREAVAGRRQAEHERYGVIDPLDETSTALRGRGQRITLYDDSAKELVDLIIGNQVEGQANQYYVRVPKENETYRSTVSISLSTKFSDWIEPDLLKLTGADLVAMKSSKPIIEEKVVQTPLGPVRSEQQTGEETVQLSREEGGTDWTLEDLDDAVEEFDNASVANVVNAVDELKIIGVRPKPPGIKADFTLDIPKDLQGDPRRAQEFARERVRELMDKGFGIFANAEGQPYLSAREGELIATTKAGVVYNLHFGNRFEGSLDDIEFGAAEKKPAEGAEEKKAETPQAGEKSDLNPDEDVQEGRYVLVRVELDKKSLGGEPVAPVEPTKPAEAGSPKKPAADAPKSDDKEKENQPKGENEADEKSADDAKKDGADAEKKSPEQTAYEQAMKDFTLKRFKFESDKAAYEKKVEEGQKQVNQLNDRFEAWYYVISAESFETLRMSRADLVKDKDVSEQPPVAAPNPSSAESAQPPAEG
ncbi:MAG: DUF4340 domain-containing protein [Planctomycetaceae bacterium]|jgi:hypothetical protein|nr:DUF4340 domain-containing protein [Planctomycetaceae bacterium]MBT6486148.1 DUF4340 domain-containing protein [Planctomycetaceae bacterium]MBT6494326.1 DUF4340 domain-containing protein [Planctomycetaceae bacterium]